MARTHYTVMVRESNGGWLASPIRYTRRVRAIQAFAFLVDEGIESTWIELSTDPETGEHKVPHTWDGAPIRLSNDPVRMDDGRD